MNRVSAAVVLALIVGTVALVVVVGLVLRPVANANTDPMTKLNLMEEVPEGYDRTQGSFPGIPGYLYPSWQPNSGLPIPGYTEYVAHGCSFCHGLQGQGGTVGGPVAGYEADIVRVFVRNGPSEMPAYSPEELSDGNLQSIIDWIAAASGSPRVPPQIPHAVEDDSDCLPCHDTSGLKPFPDDHVDRALVTCLYCHESQQ